MTGRVASVLVGALLVLTLGGCGSEQPSTSTTTGAPASKHVRERLAAGLVAADRSTQAEWVEDSMTKVTRVKAPWLQGWQVLDVLWRGVPHGQRFYAALSDDGTVLGLAGDPDSFAQMTRSAQVVVNDASLATDIAVFYLDVTRTFGKYSYRIDSFSEGEWTSNPDPAQARALAAFKAKYGALIQPPRAKSSGTGWSVTAWMVVLDCQGTVVRHHLSIAADGVVQDSSDVVATGLPLPCSL